MKKLSSLLATLSIVVAPFAVSGIAAAASSTCPEGFTGPNSNNLCVSSTTYSCTITDNNTITFTNSNDQTAATGTASGTSGSATNSNGTTFNGTVTNGSCVATVTTAPIVTPTVVTPTTTVTPPQPAAVKPAVLPDTASPTPLVTVALLVGSLGAAAVLSRLAVVLYGHFKA